MFGWIAPAILLATDSVTQTLVLVAGSFVMAIFAPAGAAAASTVWP